MCRQYVFLQEKDAMVSVFNPFSSIYKQMLFHAPKHFKRTDLCSTVGPIGQPGKKRFVFHFIRS